MEVRKKRHIKPGYEYDNLFPKSENDNKTIRRNASLDDTVAFIPKVVQQTLPQTAGIARRLKGSNTYDTCRNIWQFVYGHINYKKDEEGFEQIRSPSRTWHDRKQGVDCDCYSVFISGILTNLDIPHILRITKYHRNYFQHIYPVVPNGSRFIIIDCVTDKFDYEVPFTEKKDYAMDLQYLNGFDGDGEEELGKVIKKGMIKKSPLISRMSSKLPKKVKRMPFKNLPAQKAVNPAAPALPGSSIPKSKQKKKGFFKKVLNVVNKVNPATVLLRNGVLSAMKLNIKNVAKRLRWSYLTPEKAAAKGIDPVKFQKLVATRQKLEKIFYGAGGKPGNLRKAILGGKGNKDKAVSGLGMLPMQEWDGYMNENTPLQQLLGNEIFYSENVEGMEGFKGLGALGEPVTLASVGAAMGVIAGIVAALKQIGDIFKKKGPGSEDFDESKTDAPENNINIPAAQATVPNRTDNDLPTVINSSTNKETDNALAPVAERFVTASQTNTESSGEDGNSNTSTTTDTTNKDNNGSNDNKESFWDKNKKWIKPVAIGVGGLTVIAIGYKIMQGGKTQNKSSPESPSLSGVPRKKKKKKKNHHRRHKRKHPVALL